MLVFSGELAIGDAVGPGCVGAATFDLVLLVGLDIALEPEPARPFPVAGSSSSNRLPPFLRVRARLTRPCSPARQQRRGPLLVRALEPDAATYDQTALDDLDTSTVIMLVGNLALDAVLPPEAKL